MNHIDMIELMQMLQVLLVSGGEDADINNYLSSTEVSLQNLQKYLLEELASDNQI